MATESAGPVTRPSLLVRLRDAQDVESWRTFVQVYLPLVLSYCRRRGLQDADAADVSQDVLAELARAIRTFEYDPRRGRFRDWMGTITRRKIARFHHQRSRGAAAPAATLVDLENTVAAEPDPEWTEEFHARILQVSLERIRPHFEERTWQAFEKVWLDNCPALETARALDLPIDMVYVAKSRVLKRLREEVLLLAEDIPLLVPLD